MRGPSLNEYLERVHAGEQMTWSRREGRDHAGHAGGHDGLVGRGHLLPGEAAGARSSHDPTAFAARAADRVGRWGEEFTRPDSVCCEGGGPGRSAGRGVSKHMTRQRLLRGRRAGSVGGARSSQDPTAFAARAAEGGSVGARSSHDPTAFAARGRRSHVMRQCRVQAMQARSSTHCRDPGSHGDHRAAGAPGAGRGRALYFS